MSGIIEMWSEKDSAVNLSSSIALVMALHLSTDQELRMEDSLIEKSDTVTLNSVKTARLQ